MLSGYRNSEDLKIKINNDYSLIYQNLGEKKENIQVLIENVKPVYDFRLCLRIDEIVSVIEYSPEIQKEFDKQIN